MTIATRKPTAADYGKCMVLSHGDRARLGQAGEISTCFEPAGNGLFHVYKGQRSTPMECWFCDNDRNLVFVAA
jgi:hypothetical protein